MDRQHDIFSTGDETRLIDFFTRAHAALLAARILPPSLGILNDARHGPDWLNDRPELLTLLAEYDGPFALDNDEAGKPTFGNLRTALNVFLTGTPSGEYEFGFRTIASDESENWTCLPEGMKAFGLYFAREKGTGWGEFLENVFCYKNAPDAPRDQYDRTEADRFAEDNAHDNGGDQGRQFHFTELDAAPADLDARDDLSARVEFKVALADLDLSKVTMPEGRIDRAQRVLDAVQEAAEAEADAEAGEYFRANAHHPKVLLKA